MTADFVKINDFSNKKHDQETAPFTARFKLTDIEQAYDRQVFYQILDNQMPRFTATFKKRTKPFGRQF